LPIGVDIGSTAVRLLQLSGSPRDLRVVDVAKFAIPREAKASDRAERAFIVEQVRRLVKERQFRGREIVMALAPAQVAVRNIRMPNLEDDEDDEKAQAIAWEAQNKFPFDTETAVIQYLEAGRVRQGDEVLDEVIVFASPRVEVDSRIDLASEARLELVSLDFPRAGRGVRQDDPNRRGAL